MAWNNAAHLLINAKQREANLLLHKKRLLLSASLHTYAPHPKQAQFHALGATMHERLFMAGNRCGKTVCGALEMALHLTGEYPKWWQGARFDAPIMAWAASVSVEATRDVLQRIYLGGNDGAIGAIPPDYINCKTMRRSVAGAIDTVLIRHKSGGLSTLGFKSYDQGREKFQGTARHVVHLDEEPPIEIYEECLLRTMTAHGHMLLTMTPLMGLTPLVETFLNGKTGTVKGVVQAAWEDAPHLSAIDITRLRKSLRPHEIEAREKGVPSLGSGKVFPVAESLITTPRFNIERPEHASLRRVFGIDFGWTNPTAAVWGAYNDAEDILYITDIYQQTEASPSTHAKALKARGAWISGVCDPAGQAASQADGANLIEHYAKHGVHLSKADNAVEAGLMQLLERMQAGKLKIFADLAPWFEEFRVYRRGTGGQIVKRNDHLMDATRYLVTSGLVLARVKPQGKPAPRRVDTSGWVV